MKKSLVIMALLVVTSMFMVGNSYADTPIYEDSWQQVLSLWSGAAGDITDSEITDPYEGGDDICAKFSFPKEITWAKIGAQAFGGAIPLDLTGHTKMQFNVSANKEGVVAHFGVGSGTLDEDSCGEHTVAGDPITISSTGWTAAEIDLSKQNMSAVTNLWWMMLAAGENSSLTNPIEVFVDDIKYVGGGAGIITVTISGGTVGVSVSGNMAFGDSSYGIEMISSENAVGDKYLIDGSANIVDVQMPATLSVGDEIIVHNESISTFKVQLINPNFTIKDTGGTISPGTDIELAAGDTAHFAAKTSLILEVVGVKV